MNATADATQTQAKDDTDAYAAFNLAIDGPWQTMEEDLAKADAELADARAVANGDYNTKVMAAEIEYDKAVVAADVGYDEGMWTQLDNYINAVAPAWAAAIIAASGNDAATTAWANAWANYMMSAFSDSGNGETQMDGVYQTTEDNMLDLGTGLSAQVSAADKTLADQAGDAEVTGVTNDTAAIIAYDGKVIPAATTLTKGEIDDARAEITAEVNADKQDGEKHADDEDTRAKGYSAAQLAFLQAADPVIANDQNAERTESATNTGTAAQDEAAAIKTVDAATETETDNLVTAGKTMVDKEATADKVFVKAEVGQQVDAANAQAAATTAAVAAEPDTDFPQGETIGAPGIYIDVSLAHVSFLLPLFDPSLNNKLMGYKYFSFYDASYKPGNPGGTGFDITNYIGKEGYIQTKVFSATFDPEAKFDFFVPTTMNDVFTMLTFASKAAAGFGWSKDYCILNGKTCMGFVIDTMDQADLWAEADLTYFVPMPSACGPAVCKCKAFFRCSLRQPSIYLTPMFTSLPYRRPSSSEG